MKAQPPGVETHSAFLLTCAGGGGADEEAGPPAARPRKSVEDLRPAAAGRGARPPAAEEGENAARGDAAERSGERGETGGGEATGMAFLSLLCCGWCVGEEEEAEVRGREEREEEAEKVERKKKKSTESYVSSRNSSFGKGNEHECELCLSFHQHGCAEANFISLTVDALD